MKTGRLSAFPLKIRFAYCSFLRVGRIRVRNAKLFARPPGQLDCLSCYYLLLLLVIGFAFIILYCFYYAVSKAFGVPIVLMPLKTKSYVIYGCRLTVAYVWPRYL